MIKLTRNIQSDNGIGNNRKLQYLILKINYDKNRGNDK
jgi:hypothetical protein